MQNERPRIHIPQDRDVVPHQIILRGFARTPVGSDRRKFPDNERFNVRACGLLIVGVGSDISNVRISQADNLSRVTRIGEDFLISGEAGIENDFAAAARDSARSTAVKYAPVFQSEGGRSVLNFGQCVLREWS